MSYFKIALFALGMTAGAANAATEDYSFTGNFVGDADVLLFNFTIGAVSDVTLRSYSYAGGTMADGTVIAAGGFDPILALWDGNGNLIEEYDDGPFSAPQDPTTQSSYDAHLQLNNLAAGAYTASITQYSNFAVGQTLADGFKKSDSKFTGNFFNCSNGQFCDDGGYNRTNEWAFDILGVDAAVVSDPAPVPLPAGLPLLVAGLAGLFAASKRKKSA